MRTVPAGKRAGLTGRSPIFLSAAVVAAVFLMACSAGEATSETTLPAGEERAALAENGPAPAVEPASRPAPAPARPRPVARVYTLESGTSLAVDLAQDVSSEVALVGDPVLAQVTQAVRVESRVVIPAGSEVRGSVTEVKPAKRFGGQAMVRIAFDSLVLPNGDEVLVDGSLSAYSKKDTAKDTGTIAGGTAGGALLGKLLGGDKKDTVVGAVVGGAVGTAVASHKGDEAFLPLGSEAAVITRERVDVPADS